MFTAGAGCINPREAGHRRSGLGYPHERVPIGIPIRVHGFRAQGSRVCARIARGQPVCDACCAVLGGCGARFAGVAFSSVSNLVKRVWMKAAAVSKMFSVVDDLDSTRVRGSGMCGGERRSWI